MPLLERTLKACRILTIAEPLQRGGEAGPAVILRLANCCPAASADLPGSSEM